MKTHRSTSRAIAIAVPRPWLSRPALNGRDVWSLLATAALAFTMLARASFGDPPPGTQPAELPANARVPLSEIALPALEPPAATQPELSRRAMLPLEQAVKLMDSGQMFDAVQRIEMARRFAPGHPRVEETAAAVLNASGNDAEAVLAARSAIDAGARSALLYYLLGKSAAVRGDDADAITQFRRALASSDADQTNPKLPMIHYQLALALERQGYLLAATEQLERFNSLLDGRAAKFMSDTETGAVMRDDPAVGAIKLGELYLRLGQSADATRAMYEALTANPRSFAARVGYLDAMLAQNRRVDALASLSVLLTDFADHPQTRTVTARTLRALDAAGLAEALLQLPAVRDNVRGTIDLVLQGLRDADKPGVAEALLSGVAEQDPTQAGPFWTLAESRLDAGDNEGAWRALMKATAVDPLPVASLLELTQGAAAQMTKLAELAKGAASAEPDRAGTQVLAAVVLSAAGQGDAAVQAAQRAAELAPRTPGIKLALAQAQVMAGHTQDALKLLDELLADPATTTTPATIHLLRAKALLRDGQAEEAAEAADIALTFDRRNARAMRLRAAAYRAAEQPLLAQRDLLQAIQLAPDDMESREQLLWAVLPTGRVGETNQARDVLKRIRAAADGTPLAKRSEALVTLYVDRLNPEKAGEALDEYVKSLTQLYQADPASVPTAILLARGLAEQHDLDRAIATLEQTRQLAGADDRLRDELITLHLLASHYAQAADLLRPRIRDRDTPQDRELRIKLLTAELGQENFDAAQKLGTQLADNIDLDEFNVATLDPTDLIGRRDEFNRMLRLLDLQLRQFVISRDFAELARWAGAFADRAKTLPLPQGENTSVARGLAENLLKDAILRIGAAAGGTEALPLIDRAYPEDDAGDREDPVEYAAALIRIGELKRAVEFIDGWLDDQPAEAQADLKDYTPGRLLVLKAVALTNSGDWQAADALLSDPDGTIKLVDSVFVEGASGRGVRPVLAGAPDGLPLAEFRMSLLQLARQYGRALAVLDEWLATPEAARMTDERKQIIAAVRIDLLSRAGQHEQALAALEKHNEEEPAPYRYANLKSSILTRAGDLPGALAVLEELIERLELSKTANTAFELAGANNNLGYAWIERTMNVPDAEKRIRTGVKMDEALAAEVAARYAQLDIRYGEAAYRPTYAYADSLAWVYYKLERYDKALYWMKRSIELADATEEIDPVLWDHLGDVYYRLGNKAHARWAWEVGLSAFQRATPYWSASGLTGGRVWTLPVPSEPDVRAALRSKLDALSAGQPVPVAITAAEKAATQPAEPEAELDPSH